MREPENPHDGNAIRVLVGCLCDEVEFAGYIPRQIAAVLAPKMDAGAVLEVSEVRINRDWTGGYPRHYVRLSVQVREPVAAVPDRQDQEEVPF